MLGVGLGLNPLPRYHACSLFSSLAAKPLSSITHEVCQI